MTLLPKVQGKVSSSLILSRCHKLNYAFELGASSPNPKPIQSALDAKHPPLLELPPNQGYVVGPSHSTQPGYIQSPTVYHYTNPTTQQQVASLLPPDHPEMICLQAGAHVPHTKYGILGQFPLLIPPLNSSYLTQSQEFLLQYSGSPWGLVFACWIGG